MQFGKKLFILATIFIVACLIPWNIDSASADDIDWTDWGTENALPDAVGSYRLITDVTINDGTWNVPTGDGVNLDLNGHVIKAVTSEGCRFSVITIPKDATLNLYDGNPDAHHYFEYSSAGYYAITDSTEGTCFNGGCITGGYYDIASGNDGGGVYVEGAFNMYGGLIIGNQAYKGGGVYVTNKDGFPGSFLMDGGNICGNLANFGGGVCVNKFDQTNTCTFTISNGTISGNHATSYGGGVYVLAGDFEIQGNTRVTGNYVDSADSNVHLCSGEKITVVGALTGGEDSIGVSADEHGEYNPFAVAENSGELSATDIACFKSDSNDCSIIANEHDLAFLQTYRIYLDDGLCNHAAVASITAKVDDTTVASKSKRTSDPLPEDTDVTITVTLNPGWELSGGDNGYLNNCGESGGEDPGSLYLSGSSGTYSGDYTMVRDAYISNADTFREIGYQISYDYTGDIEFKSSRDNDGNYYYGDTITVTVTPAAMYVLDTLTVVDGEGDSVTVSGTGNTRTFTMPAADVTVSVTFARERVNTSYKDATGTLHENVSAIPLLGTETELAAGTYVVNSNLTYTNSIELTGNVTIILADGYTMNIGSEESPIPGVPGDFDCIRSIRTASLTVHGQSSGTGALNIYGGSDISGIYLSDGTFTMTGGKVTIHSGEHGIFAYLDNNGLNDVIVSGGELNITVGGEIRGITGNLTVSGDTTVVTVTADDDSYAPDGVHGTVTINGGTVEINAKRNGIEGTVTLNGGSLNVVSGWSEHDYVSAYCTGITGNVTLTDGEITCAVADGENNTAYGGTVTVTSGCTYSDGTHNYSGTLTSAEKAAIAGQRLYLFVPPEPTGVSLDKHEINVNDNAGNQTLTATIAPDGATGTLVWQTGNESVASVTGNNDNTATVIISGIGNTTITVSIEGTTYSDTCAVNVTEYICPHTNRTETPAKDPTCTEAGNNKYYHCDDCGTYLKADGTTVTTVEAETIPALGHNYEGVSYSSDDTQHWKVCSRCGEASVRENHTFGTATYRWSDDNSACTASHTCTVYDKTISETGTVTSEITAAATCTAGQKTTYTASFTKDGFATQTTEVLTSDPFGHDFIYTTSGAIITATCGREACEYHTAPLTLTLTAPASLTADGTAKAVTLAGLEAFKTATGLDISESDITYVGRNETTYASSSTPPTEPGQYTASFTLRGDFTVSLDYEIAKKPSSSGSSHKPAESTQTTTTTDSDGGKTTTTTNTTTNADGSKTTTTTDTTTKADGSVATATTQATEKLDANGNGTVEATTTETKTDASGKVTEKTVTESKGTVETGADGTKTTTTVNTAVTTDLTTGEQTTVITNEKTVESPDGTVGTVVTDENGKTLEAEANVSQKAVETALKENKPIPVPVTVNPAQAANAEEAASIQLTLPTTKQATPDHPVRVEIQVPQSGPGIIAMIRDALGKLFPVKNCYEGSVIVPVTGSCDLVIVDNSKSFADVADTMWYNEYVTFVTSREIFNGVNATSFAPNDTMNRAMLAQVLYNFDGGVATGDGTTFGDVKANDWFNTAVGWAYENGIVNGFGKNFGSLYSVSRQDMATILYRYAKAAGYDVSANGDLSKFTDASSVSDYAVDAIKWAVGAGIIDGNGGRLDPTGSATRAQVAAIMTRFVRNVR